VGQRCGLRGTTILWRQRVPQLGHFSSSLGIGGKQRNPRGALGEISTLGGAGSGCILACCACAIFINQRKFCSERGG
jgi:hypothetical protein